MIVLEIAANEDGLFKALTQPLLAASLIAFGMYRPGACSF
jgi:hypothetical protein